MKERARIVNERTDYGEGYEFNRFGFGIGDRIFMVGSEGYGVDPERAKHDRELCETIVNRWNACIAASDEVMQRLTR